MSWNQEIIVVHPGTGWSSRRVRSPVPATVGVHVGNHVYCRDRRVVMEQTIALVIVISRRQTAIRAACINS